MRIAWCEVQTAQAIAKAGAECELSLRRNLFGIEIVVAVGIQQAVANDRGRHLHAVAEQRLNSANRPGIAAGLGGIGKGETWIEAPRPLRKLGADGEESVGEQMHSLVLKAKSDRRKTRKNRHDPTLGGSALRASTANLLCLALNGVQGFVVGFFSSRLLLWA